MAIGVTPTKFSEIAPFLSNSVLSELQNDRNVFAQHDVENNEQLVEHLVNQGVISKIKDGDDNFFCKFQIVPQRDAEGKVTSVFFKIISEAQFTGMVFNKKGDGDSNKWIKICNDRTLINTGLDHNEGPREIVAPLSSAINYYTCSKEEFASFDNCFQIEEVDQLLRINEFFKDLNISLPNRLSLIQLKPKQTQEPEQSKAPEQHKTKNYSQWAFAGLAAIITAIGVAAVTLQLSSEQMPQELI